MNRYWGFIIIVGLFSLSILNAEGFPKEDTSFTYGFYLENDLFPKTFNEDRNYTQGTAFSLSSVNLSKSALFIPLNWIDDRLRMNKLTRNIQKNHLGIITLTGSAFTPDDIRAEYPIPEDRPYAFILALNFRKILYDDKNLNAISSELSLGALGLDIGEKVQTAIHRTSGNSPIPEGWDNQISNGGEPTALYRVGLERNLIHDFGILDFNKCKHWLQIMAKGNLSVGYYTQAVIGMNMRLGWIRSPFYDFNSLPITENRTTDGKIVPAWELYFFAGANELAIAYNALMQGQFKKSAVTVKSADIEPFQWDYRYGIGASCFGITLNVMTCKKSEEFKGTMARKHCWSGVFLSWKIRI